MGKEERLDKLLSNMGIGSRKEVRMAIRDGLVKLNGEVCREPDKKVDPEKTDIRAGDDRITYRRYCYLMMNKAAGCLSATEDRRLPTVMDYLPESLKRLELFPAGRLDRDTEGLLLLTNDGAAAHGLTAPKKHVDKCYFVRYSGDLDDLAKKRFQEGLPIDQGVICKPAALLRGENNECRVIVSEGKFHQVKRMMAAVGVQVTYLKRLSIGPLLLDETLRPGEYRLLSAQEEQALLLAAGVIDSITGERRAD